MIYTISFAAWFLGGFLFGLILRMHDKTPMPIYLWIICISVGPMGLLALASIFICRAPIWGWLNKEF